MPMTATGAALWDGMLRRRSPPGITRGQTGDALINIENSSIPTGAKTIARPTARTLDAREKKRAVLNEKRSL